MSNSKRRGVAELTLDSGVVATNAGRGNGGFWTYDNEGCGDTWCCPIWIDSEGIIPFTLKVA